MSKSSKKDEESGIADAVGEGMMEGFGITPKKPKDTYSTREGSGYPYGGKSYGDWSYPRHTTPHRQAQGGFWSGSGWEDDAEDWRQPQPQPIKERPKFEDDDLEIPAFLKREKAPPSAPLAHHKVQAKSSLVIRQAVMLVDFLNEAGVTIDSKADRAEAAVRAWTLFTVLVDQMGLVMMRGDMMDAKGACIKAISGAYRMP